MKDDLIVRYLSGEASADEALALMDWIQNPANRAYFEQLESAWYRANAETKPRFDRLQAWAKVAPIAQVKPAGRRRLIIASGTWLQIAAAVALLVLVGVFLFMKYNSRPVETIATIEEPKAFTLPDASTIILYKHTALQYPKEFQGATREVRLTQGEAFFKIQADSKKPFIVHTGSADIKVVGTEFNVIVTHSGTEIDVKEGKVIVYGLSDSVSLTKGYSAIIGKVSDSIKVNNSIDSNVWGYATRKLTFKNTPVKNAILAIEKAYPNTISVSNESINRCNVTATFENDSIEKIVNLVAEILNLTVKRNEKGGFVLEGEGCQ